MKANRIVKKDGYINPSRKNISLIFINASVISTNPPEKQNCFFRRVATIKLILHPFLHHRVRFIRLNCPAFNSDLASVVAGLDHDIVLFDTDNPSDNSAGGNNFIANLNIISHILGFFIHVFSADESTRNKTPQK